MKRKLCVLLLLLSLPTMVRADARADYAWQWSLDIGDGSAGAYALALDESVYRHALRADLGDVLPLDGDGNPQSAALQAAAVATAAPPPRWQALALFTLPAAASVGAELEVVAERDASGAVRRIETRSAAAPPSAAPSWLLDASALAQPLQGVRLQWQAQPRMQAEVRVEGSDDLRDWQLLVPRASLIDLDNGRERLQQRQIAFQARVRYLRITALSQPAPLLTGAEAELAPATPASVWHWLELEGNARDGGFEFVLPGRFPIARADLRVSGGGAQQWRLQSRDDSEQPWQWRAGPWLGFQVGAAARSAPRVLAMTRDRYWRLSPTIAASAAAPPRLLLGWQAETLLLLAQGRPPYALAVGSARARREEAILQPVLASLRGRYGPQWQPPPAHLQGRQRPLAGEAALRAPRDWTTWLLWALLLAGSALVAVLAFGLLRAGPRSGNGGIPPAD